MTITQLIPPIVAQLIQKDEARLSDELGKLTERNYALGGTQYGFLFQGEFMTLIVPKLRRQALKKAIQPTLIGEALSYSNARKQLYADRDRMIHGLTLLVRPCKSLQDIRDAIPDSLKNMSAELAPLPRTRPEAYTLSGNTFQLHDYKATEDLVAFYVANQLLY